MCLISVFAIYMCMPVWTCLINSYNLYLSFKQNACFTDLFLVCITFERISTQHVEGHDGRSLSSHCWRMEPATGDWQAWLREWQWFQDGSSNVSIPWTWHLASFLHASNAPRCVKCNLCVNWKWALHVFVVADLYESLSHIRCCHQDGMVWTCYEPLVEWNSCCMKP